MGLDAWLCKFQPSDVIRRAQKLVMNYMRCQCVHEAAVDCLDVAVASKQQGPVPRLRVTAAAGSALTSLLQLVTPTGRELHCEGVQKLTSSCAYCSSQQQAEVNNSVELRPSREAAMLNSLPKYSTSPATEGRCLDRNEWLPLFFGTNANGIIDNDRARNQ